MANFVISDGLGGGLTIGACSNVKHSKEPADDVEKLKRSIWNNTLAKSGWVNG